MKAYAVMDGGGAKGAALAGCLLAAEEAGIRFVGYGGTSAGSIVALLACVGYSGAELEHIMTAELKLGEFLKEVKPPLELLNKLPGDLEGLNVFNALPGCGNTRERRRHFGSTSVSRIATALWTLSLSLFKENSGRTSQRISPLLSCEH